MKPPKLWRTFLVTFFAFVPLALFAAIDTYENPLGCGLDTIPEFIYAVLMIVVKVGIPIATIFIIWAGYLFLTAQGDETKLKKAKHAFVWACVGTAVLLGAWLLATAINATIQNLGGGTSGGSGTTIDGGCGSDGGGTSGSPSSPASSGPSTAVSISCPQNMLTEEFPIPYVSLNLENNPFRDIFPETNQCSFGSAMETLVDYAYDLPYENSYIFMQGAHINGKTVDVTLDVAEGTNSGTTIAYPSDTQQLINKYDPSKIYIVHTHPLQTIGAGSRAQPSSADISVASNYPVWDDRVEFVVADPTGVWLYNPPVFTEWSDQANKAGVNMVASGAPSVLVGADQCGQVAVIENSLSGQYGPEAKAWAENIMADSGEYITASKLNIEAVSGINVTTGEMLTVAERDARTTQSVTILGQLGVPITYLSKIQLGSCP